MNLTQKILKNHLLKGELVPGEEIAIRIDQTLTQDSTGTMAYLQLEAMGVDRVKTERSMAYIDHNTLQTGFENADDHQYITTVAKKHGIYSEQARQRYLSSGAAGTGAASRAGRCWAAIAIPPQAARWECWPLARADWTWPWLWAAAHIT